MSYPAVVIRECEKCNLDLHDCVCEIVAAEAKKRAEVAR